MGSMMVLNKAVNVKITTKTFIINSIRTKISLSLKNKIQEIE